MNSKKIYLNNFFVTRLPQLKTRSNYNPFLGIYTGKGLNYLSNVLLNFFKKVIILFFLNKRLAVRFYQLKNFYIFYLFLKNPLLLSFLHPILFCFPHQKL